MTALNHLYVVGDVQGCFKQFDRLLQLIWEEDKEAHIILLGDTVNRGPESLTTLRHLMALDGKVNTLLGNHDLHLLAVAHGIRPLERKSDLHAILDAPDRDQLLDWLRHRPLACWIEDIPHETDPRYEATSDGYLLVHAGVLPSWTVEETLNYAKEVETILQGEHFIHFLQHMYGDEPTQWTPTLSGYTRLRTIVNVLTRLRFCTQDDGIEFQVKEGAAHPPPGFLPWFDCKRHTEKSTIVFGHWAALGLLNREHIIGLDTGCVWGGKLTAMKLKDRHILQVSCPAYHQVQKKSHH